MLNKSIIPALATFFLCLTMKLAYASEEVRILGFGGTFAGEAEGAYIPKYKAAERCLVEGNGVDYPQPIITLLKTAINDERVLKCDPSQDSSAGIALEKGSNKNSTCGNKTQKCTLTIPKRNGADDTKAVKLVFDDVDRLDSAKMTPKDWLMVGKKTIEAQKNSTTKGVVITHGTDTMEETAYILSLLSEIKKPVVLVGSMRAPNHLSADGLMNLLNGAATAGDNKASSIMLVMNERIYGARDVTKTNTTNVGTFESRNTGQLGTVYFGDARFYNEAIDRKSIMCDERGQPQCLSISHLKSLSNEESKSIPIIYEQAGGTNGLITAATSEGVEGIVIASTGNGGTTQTTDEELSKVRTPVYVAVSSRTGSGRTTNVPCIKKTDQTTDCDPGDPNPNVKIFTADNLNPQKARILLMMALAATEGESVDARMEKIMTYFSIY